MRAHCDGYVSMGRLMSTPQGIKIKEKHVLVDPEEKPQRSIRHIKVSVAKRRPQSELYRFAAIGHSLSPAHQPIELSLAGKKGRISLTHGPRVSQLMSMSNM